MNKLPRSVLMDAGGEFTSVRRWCNENNIKTYLPYSSFHGSFIERFNQSIKNRLYRWMDANQTEKYIDHLKNILRDTTNLYILRLVNHQIRHGIISLYTLK